MPGIQVAPDGTGKTVRTVTVAGQEQQVVTLAKSDGTLLDSGITVSGPLTDTQLRAARVPVDGSGVTQPVSGTFYQVTQPVSGPLTDGQLRATRVPVDGSGVTQPVSGAFYQATQPVSGPLTDTQLRATRVPVDGSGVTQPVSGSFFQATQPVSGPLTDTQLRATRVPVDGSGVTQPVSGAFFQATQPVSATNLDVLLSTRTKPADQQHVIVDTMTPALALDATVNGLLKPASTLAALTAIINALPVGSNKIGTVDIATAVAVAKGIQGVNALPVQELNDSGRNTTNLFMAAPVITTAAEVMQSLTGYKSGAAVGATVTPAVVTAGKTYRVGRIVISFTAATVIGGALIRLRANLSGVAVIGSPLVSAWYIGLATSFVAGETQTVVIDYPEGLEFAAGTGIAVGVIGGGAVPTTGTITGFVQISIEGYEY